MPPTDSLAIHLTPDSDGTIELVVEVAAGGFAGSSSAWFSVDDVRKFAQAIMAYPLDVSDQPLLVGGHWDKNERGILADPHVSIRAYPVGARGQVGLRIRLATPGWDDARPDELSLVETEILTTYQSLGEFAAQLSSTALGEHSVTLEADVLL